MTGLDWAIVALYLTGTLAIGDAGARNAALFALRQFATHDEALRKKLESFASEQAAAALEGELE